VRGEVPGALLLGAFNGQPVLIKNDVLVAFYPCPGVGALPYRCGRVGDERESLFDAKCALAWRVFQGVITCET